MLNHQLQFHICGTSEPTTFAFTKSPVRRDYKTNLTSDNATAFEQDSESNMRFSRRDIFASLDNKQRNVDRCHE